jgi:cyclopropane-fatty-acyl-phospholipid synthase
MKEAIKHLVGKIKEAEPQAQLAVEFWDGQPLRIGDCPRVVLRLKSEQVASRVIAQGFLGFGEAYMSGELEIEGDLQELLRLGIAAHFDQVQPSFREKLRLLPSYLKSKCTVKRAPLNIAHHYDRGNEFYALYLDESMTYSCAYFKQGDESLEQAQRDKYDHIARKLMLRPGETLLDIGCGWGGMLIHAARNYGVKGLGNTLSHHQYEYASRKIEELGLQDRIEVVLKDYRHLSGKFDKVVSIGMFEHVGKKYMPDFMEKVSELLKPGGLGLLHTIGKETRSPTDQWTLRYIFPGGYLPSLPEITLHLGEAGLSILDVENLRLHYARTLDLWARNFETNIPKANTMFDEAFVRMWRLYLNASSTGFKYAQIRLYQLLFSCGLNNHLPITRGHVYARHIEF